MGLDIRLPIGMMFTLIGLLLSISGYLTKDDAVMYKCSLGININLVWGLVLFSFGGIMLIFVLIGKRSTKGKAAPKSSESAKSLR